MLIHDSNEWQFFIDSSCESPIAALVHSGNEKPSVPYWLVFKYSVQFENIRKCKNACIFVPFNFSKGYSRSMKEDYESMKTLLEHVKYREHNWLICVDFKVINIIMRLSSGNIKHPHFLCTFDSRADRSIKFDRNVWAPRNQAIIGEYNVQHPPLIEDKTRILLPPLHIKLELVTQFLKQIDEDSRSFQIIVKKFQYRKLEF